MADSSTITKEPTVKKTSKHPRTSPSPQLGNIRIIGGQWRGRKLPVVPAEGLRPTPDRVKETVFNWLQFELQDSYVLDLFAGSGSLGIEALSRGARGVCFAETWAPAVKQLEQNLATLGGAGQVYSKGAEECLAAQQVHSVDVVFLDPPFAQGWLEKIIPQLEAEKILKTGGWVYVESGTQDNFSNFPATWRLHREKKAGQVTFRLFQVED